MPPKSDEVEILIIVTFTFLRLPQLPVFSQYPWDLDVCNAVLGCCGVRVFSVSRVQTAVEADRDSFNTAGSGPASVLSVVLDYIIIDIFNQHIISINLIIAYFCSIFIRAIPSVQ